MHNFEFKIPTKNVSMLGNFTVFCVKQLKIWCVHQYRKFLHVEWAGCLQQGKREGFTPFQGGLSITEGDQAYGPYYSQQRSTGKG